MLRIFISHKMPTDTPLAQVIASKLALYAGNQVKVTHAGSFRYGEAWRRRIQEELDQAHWLIFLYTAQDEDWGFCLFECGYFRRIMESDEGKTKRLITFCRRQEQISDALKEFNALLIDEKSIAELLEDIYLRDPWKVNSGLNPATLIDTANEIVSEFRGTERVEQNFDVAPSVTIEMVVSDHIKDDLQHGRFPEDSVISGTKDWQRLFGREIDTGAWTWQELTATWPFTEVYEFLIAKMISDALNGRMPKGTILKVPGFGTDADEMYRMTLRHYERMRGSKHRFHFTAAPFDLHFNLPDSRESAEETVLYNLINLTWYFRRRMVDHLYERLLNVLSMRESDRPLAAVNEVYDALGRELMQVVAQAIVRGLDNPRVLERALNRNDKEAQELLESLMTYNDLQQRIFQAMSEGPKGLHSVACNLYILAMQNYEVYRIAATKYANLAKKLLRPSEPPGECPQG